MSKSNIKFSTFFNSNKKIINSRQDQPKPPLCHHSTSEAILSRFQFAGGLHVSSRSWQAKNGPFPAKWRETADLRLYFPLFFHLSPKRATPRTTVCSRFLRGNASWHPFIGQSKSRGRSSAGGGGAKSECAISAWS